MFEIVLGQLIRGKLPLNPNSNPKPNPNPNQGGGNFPRGQLSGHRLKYNLKTTTALNKKLSDLSLVPIKITESLQCKTILVFKLFPN